MHVEPKTMAADQLNVLTNLAELVVRQLEKDHILKLQKLVGLLACSDADAVKSGCMYPNGARQGVTGACTDSSARGCLKGKKQHPQAAFQWPP